MGDSSRESDLLIVLDPAQRIATASPNAPRILGRGLAPGVALSDLLPPMHPLLRLVQVGQNGAENGRIELEGHPWWMRVQLCSDGWTILQGSRAPEAELRAGLDEAQLLLREAQHRARNQLQTLLAYVRRMAGDAAWFRAFEGTVATSMALQDHLRLPEVRGRVDSATFLRRLASALPGLEAGALAADVDLGVAVAARLGMVVAQLAADPGGVALRTRAEAEVLAVEVDGVGAPPPSADLGLCQGLVAQLGGSFTLAEGPPFRAVVVVPR